MNCNNNQNNNNGCGCNCNPHPTPAPEPVDINMNVCDRNMDMLPMLQTYSTKVLKPNIDGCCKKNILKQCMMNCENYKYVIKWDFDLDGKIITVPENCILEFDGGSLKNGTIVGQDTLFINVGDVAIWGENLTREGTWVEKQGGQGLSDAFSSIKVGESTINANGSDTFELEAGENVTLTPDPEHNKIKIECGGGSEQVQADWEQDVTEAPDYIKNKPTIDDELSAFSENAVQNKVINQALNDKLPRSVFDPAINSKQNILTFDDAPRAGSNNPVKSSGIKSAIDAEATERATAVGNISGALTTLTSNLNNNYYNKTQVNNLISNTPDTDVIVVDVPAGSDIATYLEANIPAVDRPNNVFRVPGTTSYSEWAYDGTNWVKLDEKEYSIDTEVPDVLGDNPVASKTLYEEFRDLKRIWSSQYVVGIPPAAGNPSEPETPDPINETFNTSGDSSLVIPLKGTETIVMGYPPDTGYYTLATSYDYPNFTRSASEIKNRTQMSSSLAYTIQANGAKYLIIVRTIGDTDRFPTLFTIDGVNMLETIHDVIESKETKEHFNNIVGDGLCSDIEFEYTDSSQAGENYGLADWVRVLAGQRIVFDIRSRGNGNIILAVSTAITSQWYDVGEKDYVLYTVKNNDAYRIKSYTGTYTPTVDCFVRARGFIYSEYDPYNISDLKIYRTVTSLLQEKNSYGNVKAFTLGSPQNILTTVNESIIDAEYTAITENTSVAEIKRIINQDYYIGFPSIVTVEKDRLYYMYYEGGKSHYVTPNQRRGLCFAYSVDGFNWVRDIPAGIDPVVTLTIAGKEVPTNMLFPLDANGNQQPVWQQSVIKVLDAAKPFRMIATIGTSAADYTMYMWKSADGIHWEDRVEVSGLSYDTQFSAIPCGDLIKVYCRLWDYQMAYVSDKPDNRRHIGVMFIDLDGNIVTPATILFGPGMYNSAAFKIDNKRELLIPTYFDTLNDECTYKAYIVSDDVVMESSEVEDFLKLSGDGWGTVNPGFILIDGDMYITYVQRHFSHGTNNQNPAGTLIEYGGEYWSIPPTGNNFAVDVRIVPLYWAVKGRGNNAKQ